MKMKFVFLLLFSLILLGCTEKYNAVIDTKISAIVVEGCITNLKESYIIKLSKATAYDSSKNALGVLGATVSIQDDLGINYTFHEYSMGYYYKTKLGYYYSDTSEFVAKVGRSYTLHIEMDNGDIYESSVQKMMSPATVDSIHGLATSNAETFVDLSYLSDSIFQFRFENILMQCYSFWLKYTLTMKNAGKPWPQDALNCDLAPCPYVIYVWQKNNLSSNMTPTTNIFASKSLKNNTASIFSFNTDYKSTKDNTDSCGLTPDGDIACRQILVPSGFEGKILQTRIYALNYEASLYYTEIDKQLAYSGKIFDPVAVQLIGNVRCVNHPEKLVLGLFEVSPCISKSYWLYVNYVNGTIYYKPIMDISGVPAHGMSQDIPDYWSISFP